MGQVSYAPLWVKSNFSFLEGASHPEELVDRARALGLPALALTDRDSVSGSVRAHVQALECGLPLIHGAQISVGEPDELLGLGEIGAAKPAVRKGRSKPGALEASGSILSVSRRKSSPAVEMPRTADSSLSTLVMVCFDCHL